MDIFSSVISWRKGVIEQSKERGGKEEQAGVRTHRRETLASASQFSCGKCPLSVGTCRTWMLPGCVENWKPSSSEDSAGACSQSQGPGRTSFWIVLWYWQVEWASSISWSVSLNFKLDYLEKTTSKFYPVVTFLWILFYAVLGTYGILENNENRQ